MLANQLITNNYPTVEPVDKVSFALQLMEEFDILHIAVVDDDKYLGLVSKDDLLDINENAKLLVLQNDFFKGSVKAGEHFLSALKLATQNNLSVVAVVGIENEWIGAITGQELLKASTVFTGAEEQGAVIVLELEKKAIRLVRLAGL